MGQKVLLDAKRIETNLQKLALELVENHGDFSDTVLIGLQPRGSFLAKRLSRLLETKYNIKNLKTGFLDTTFYRDDFRRRDEPLVASSTNINFVIEDKRVVFIDDVLFSGRSIRSALTAIQSYGRPKTIELLVLIDRKSSRHLPIQPNYKGEQIDAVEKERIVVNWKENSQEDVVYLIEKN